MSCQQCVCNLCAKSVELPVTLFTPGEAAEPCFTCDECRRYGGDYSKPTQERRSCGMYQAPAKMVGVREVFGKGLLRLCRPDLLRTGGAAM